MSTFLLIVLFASLPAMLAIYLAKREARSPFRWPRRSFEQTIDGDGFGPQEFYVVEEPEGLTLNGAAVEDTRNQLNVLERGKFNS